MKKMLLLCCAVLLLILTAGCDFSTPDPAPDQNAIATSVAETLAANQPPATDPAPQATTEPTAEPTIEPTADPYTVYAPAPLGPGNTGLIFDFGTCYDLDSFLPIDSADPECDLILGMNGGLTPQNGALINGADVSFNPPSKGECMDSDLLPDLLAPLSDLYLCFQTSQGSYGFFVQRDYQLDQNRLIFDMYIFP